jgi:hypothetical protein
MQESHVHSITQSTMLREIISGTALANCSKYILFTYLFSNSISTSSMTSGIDCYASQVTATLMN